MKNMKLYLTWILILLTTLATNVAAQRGTDDLTPMERLAPVRVKTNLQTARKLIRDRKLSFEVGLTGVSEIDLDQLTGNIVPPNIAKIAAQQNINAAKILQVNPQQLLDINLIKLPLINPKFEIEIDKFGNITKKSDKPVFKPGPTEEEKKTAAEAAKNSPQKCVAGDPSYDFRINHFALPIRRQQCRNCWAYAAEAVFEYAFIKRNVYVLHIKPFDTSEQFLVSNGNAGDCKGGYVDKANMFLNSFGVMSETQYPDTGTNGTPVANLPLNPFLPKTQTWGFVDPVNQSPSVESIKKAICAYGPISAGIYATEAFKNYTEGVFDEGATGVENHAVVIVGWDDSKQAWIIRNSWGTKWGNNAGYGSERGYAYVKYHTNGIGNWAQWVVTN